MWDSTDKAPELRVKKPRTAKPRKRLEVCIGAKVDCYGLVSAAQYNGSQGHITSGPNDKGRWEVQLDFHFPLKTLSLLATNLQPKPSCGWEVVSAGLSLRTTDDDVKELFQRFGKLRTCKLTRDSDGVSKQVALIEFCNKTDAEKAIEELHEQVLDHNVMKVQWSTMAKQEMGLLKLKGEASNSESDDDKADAPRRTFQEKEEALRRPAFSDAPKAQAQFAFGTQVVLQGLRGAAQYNGLTAQVEGIAADGRYEVLLVLAGGTMKTIAVKPQNLVAAVQATEAESPRESTPREAEAAGGERERRSTGDSGDSGVFVSPSDEKAGAEPKAKPVTLDESAAACPSLPRTPSELDKLSAKELKQLLIAHRVNVTDCFDKAALVEKGLALIAD